MKKNMNFQPKPFELVMEGIRKSGRFERDGVPQIEIKRPSEPTDQLIEIPIRFYILR